MNHKTLVALALAVATLLFAFPAMAGGFSVYGAYWDVDELDSTAGGGVKLGIPLGNVVNLDLRGTFYQQIDDENFFDRVFDDRESPFIENGLDIIPIDVGLSVNFAPRGSVVPFLGGGVSYFLLDADRGEVDDEVGWYANGGVEFASRGNWGFFVEGLYRSATGTVESSPEDFSDIGDIEGIDFDDVEFDLEGFGANAGVIWRW